MKLFICDNGDSSVGISAQQWEVEVPFTKEFMSFDDEEYEEHLSWFREKMIEAYRIFCETKCVAMYDFELDLEAEFESRMDECDQEEAIAFGFIK